MSENAMNRREFLKLIGAGTIALTVPSLSATPSRPNIVVIVADDLGYADLGCQGCKDIPTPNIDSIAINGIRFTNGYVSCPVCSPTRAGLMTGRYQQRFGHEFNPGPMNKTSESFGLPLTETTFASRLQAAGYSTGMVGKWHLGYDQKYSPLARGFDEFFGFLGGAHSYQPDRPADGSNPIIRGDKPVQEKEYLTDAFGREAVAFIRHARVPFFLYLAFNAVHTPLEVTNKYLERFRGIEDEKRRTFAGMLSAMDDAVGRVLSAIREKHVEDNTLIFFISDNGGPTPANTSRNDPLRGFKSQVYEGGIRVPFLMQWKGCLPTGITYDAPVISLDIAPTALAAAGIKIKHSRFDGVNLLPYVNLLPCLEGNRPSEQPHEILYWRMGPIAAVREGNWKLVKTASGVELYDLASDVGETKDLSLIEPNKLKQLKEKLSKWESELATPLWGGKGKRRQQPNRGKYISNSSFLTKHDSATA